MTRISLYRTLPLAFVAAAILFATGCDDMMKKHDALKEESYGRWNMTRMAVMYQLAEQQYEVGDYDKCKKTMEDAMALKTPYGPLQTLAGKVEIEKGSLELAASYLKEGARLDPTNPEPLYLLGIVYQRWQKNDVAADYYQQAWDRKPSEALYMLAVAEMKITLGQLDDAQKMLEGKLVYFEQSAGVRVALARIASLKNDHATACRYYGDAVILMPEDQKMRRSYAEELFFAGRYADAASIFEDMRKQDDVADKDGLILLLGQSYIKLHRPYDARNCLQELVRDNPSDTIAYLELGEACVETGDLSIALAASHKVEQLEPDNEKAFILNAVVQQKQRNWADAAYTLQKAERLAPTDSTILCMLGYSAQELGKKDEAVSFYQKAVDVNPKDSWANELLEKAKPVVQQGAAPIAAPTPTAAATPAPAPAAAEPAAKQVSTADEMERADETDDSKAP